MRMITYQSSISGIENDLVAELNRSPRRLTDEKFDEIRLMVGHEEMTYLADQLCALFFTVDEARSLGYRLLSLTNGE